VPPLQVPSAANSARRGNAPTHAKFSATPVRQGASSPPSTKNRRVFPPTIQSSTRLDEPQVRNCIATTRNITEGLLPQYVPDVLLCHAERASFVRSWGRLPPPKRRKSTARVIEGKSASLRACCVSQSIALRAPAAQPRFHWRQPLDQACS